MPNMDKMFSRMAESFSEHGISVERITWLSGIGMDDCGVRDYLKEEILYEDEKELKSIFGETIGSRLSELLGEEGDGAEDALEELLRMGGWLVQAAYREPDPRTVKFENNRAMSWHLSPGAAVKHIYSDSLCTALCRSLLWGHRLERRAIETARFIQAKRGEHDD